MIKDHFNLPGPSLAEMMNRVHLEEVRDDELPQLLEMQKEIDKRGFVEGTIHRYLIVAKKVVS